jgi:hypothetical protein
LFISIPMSSKVPIISEEVITLVILMTIFLMMIGNIFYKRKYEPVADLHNEKKGPIFPVNV